ncbi:TPA: LysM peptidoglycan-binding domain-containing protein [Streptococcus suis]
MEKKQIFSLRKLSVGLVSMSVASLVFLGQSVVSADSQFLVTENSAELELTSPIQSDSVGSDQTEESSQTVLAEDIEIADLLIEDSVENGQAIQSPLVSNPERVEIYEKDIQSPEAVKKLELDTKTSPVEEATDSRSLSDTLDKEVDPEAIVKKEQELALAKVSEYWEANSLYEVKEELNRQSEQGMDSYVVQWGDTLSTISAASNQTVTSLAQLNNIKNPDLIYTGQLLKGVIHQVKQVEVAGLELEKQLALKKAGGQWTLNSTDEVAKEIERQESVGLQDYVIQWGDTLSVISAVTGKSIQAIASENSIVNPNLIYTGQVLRGILRPIIRFAPSITHPESIEIPPSPAKQTSEEVVEDAIVNEEGFSEARIAKKELTRNEETKEPVSLVIPDVLKVKPDLGPKQPIHEMAKPIETAKEELQPTVVEESDQTKRVEAEIKIEEEFPKEDKPLEESKVEEHPLEEPVKEELSNEDQPVEEVKVEKLEENKPLEESKVEEHPLEEPVKEELPNEDKLAEEVVEEVPTKFVVVSGYIYDKNDTLLEETEITISSNTVTPFTVTSDVTGYFYAHLKENEVYHLKAENVDIEITAHENLLPTVKSIEGKLETGRKFSEENDSYRLNSQVIYLDDAKYITEFANDKVVTLSNIADIKKGDILIVPPSKIYEQPQAIKVTSFENVDGKTTIHYEKPNLFDVIRDLDIRAEEFNLEDAYFVPAEGVEVIREGVDEGTGLRKIDLSVSQQFKAGIEGKWDSEGKSNQGIKAELTLSAAGKVKSDAITVPDWFRGEFGKLDLPNFDMATSLEFGIDGNVEFFTGKKKDVKEKKVYFGRFYFPTSLPGLSISVPIFGKFEVGGKLQYGFSGSTEISNSLKLNNFKPEYTSNLENKFKSGKFNAEVELKVGPEFEVEMSFVGVSVVSIAGFGGLGASIGAEIYKENKSSSSLVVSTEVEENTATSGESGVYTPTKPVEESVDKNSIIKLKGELFGFAELSGKLDLIKDAIDKFELPNEGELSLYTEVKIAEIKNKILDYERLIDGNGREVPDFDSDVSVWDPDADYPVIAGGDGTIPSYRILKSYSKSGKQWIIGTAGTNEVYALLITNETTGERVRMFIAKPNFTVSSSIFKPGSTLRIEYHDVYGKRGKPFTIKLDENGSYINHSAGYL